MTPEELAIRQHHIEGGAVFWIIVVVGLLAVWLIYDSRMRP